MFLILVQCSNGHKWDADANMDPDQGRPKCPQCGQLTIGPVDPPDVTFKMQLKSTGEAASKAPVITVR